MLRIVRWLLGKLILSIDFITRPKATKRSHEDQTKLDTLTSGLSLYQFEACPFCVKVRREIHRHNLNIDVRDAKNDPTFKDELIVQGGRHQVPCLRIEADDGKVDWLYESNDIIAYLQNTLKLA